MASFEKKKLPKPGQQVERDLKQAAELPAGVEAAQGTQGSDGAVTNVDPAKAQTGVGDVTPVDDLGKQAKLEREKAEGPSHDQPKEKIQPDDQVRGQSRPPAAQRRRERIEVNLRTEFDHPELVEIPAGLQVRLNALFVASDDFEQHRQAGFSRTEGRVFIVYGPEHSGKFTSAVALGLELRRGELEEPRLASCQVRPDDRISLLHVARDEVAQGAVCVLRDAFARSIALESLRSPTLDALNAALVGRCAYLILTTEHPLERLAVSVETISASLSSKQLDQVFDKHSHRYEELERVQVRPELISLARRQWPSLKPVLQQPAQIDRFFHRLGELPGDATAQALEELARQVASLGRESVQPWFDGLRINEKLLALLIGILPGIRRSRLEGMYARAVKLLREDGLTRLRDPRETGFDELLERVAATPAHFRPLADPAITFRDASYTDEVARQVHSHHELLWSLAPMMVEMSEESSDPPSSPLRRGLGTALAKAGWSHRSKLRAHLETLARHPSASVVAVAGFALAAIFRLDRRAAGYLDDLLAAWVRSGDRDLMWAVGMAAWQIGEAIALSEADGSAQDQASAAALRQQLFDRLRDLAENAGAFSAELWDIAAAAGGPGDIWIAAATLDNLTSVTTALVEMAADGPAPTIAEIRAWLSQSNADDVRWTALWAAHTLFHETGIRGELAPALATDLLPLVEPLLELDADDTETQAVMLRALAKSLASPLLAANITAHLVRLASRCSDRVASNLIAGLAREWLTSESAEACRLGHALIVRCAVMHGATVSPAGLQRGLVAAEAAGGCRDWFGRAVQSLLGARLDASLVWLGSLRAEARPNVPVPSYIRVGPHGGRPLLLLPALENACPQPDTIVLLSRAQVLDLADGETARWMAHLIRVVVGNAWDPRTGVPALLVDPEAAGGALSAIAARIDADRARALARLDGPAWWKALAPHLGAGEDQRARIWMRLAAWADRLEDAATAAGDEDVARRALVTILWLTTVDLPETTHHLKSWLEPESPPNRRALAIAAARLLFRVWRHRETPPIAIHREILDLAAPVVESGWEGAVLVLGALHEWLREPAWSLIALGDWDQEGGEMDWVRSLILRYPQPLEQLLQRWRGERPGDRSGARETAHDDRLSPEGRFASRLALRLAISAAGTLPELAPGRSYVVLLLDTAAADQEALDLVDAVGAGLIEHWRKAVEQRTNPPALLAYRLGERIPLALPGEDVAAHHLLDSRRRRRPRLLSPIFETLPLDRVDHIILLLAGPPAVDACDWEATTWKERLQPYDLLYGVAGRHMVEVILEAALAAPGDRAE